MRIRTWFQVMVLGVLSAASASASSGLYPQYPQWNPWAASPTSNPVMSPFAMPGMNPSQPTGEMALFSDPMFQAEMMVASKFNFNGAQSFGFGAPWSGAQLTPIGVGALTNSFGYRGVESQLNNVFQQMMPY
jgi:hypothetical protein